MSKTEAKIRVKAVMTGKGPAYHVACDACGHDDYLLPLVGFPLAGAALTDACLRAERMSADHLYSLGAPGRRGCPIRDFAWELESRDAA